MPEREILETDVLIVGAGPAGLACAVRLMQLAPPKPNVLVLEKGATVGAHILSGCILDPRALAELLPNWSSHGAPVRQKVSYTQWAWLTETRRLDLFRALGLLLPAHLRNEGSYLVSLGELAAWLAEQARQRGVEILEGVAAADLLLDGEAVHGVRLVDTGRRPDGTPGPDFAPGAEIRARVTVLADGTHGNLTQKLIRGLRLDAGRAPQTYGLGLKELWEVPPDRLGAGMVLHTLGYPLHPREGHAFGGGFVYGLSPTRAAVGLVVGLDYEDPSLDPHLEFQRWKDHPAIRAILDDGELLCAGAKTLPEGGYDALPRLCAGGALLVGDAAGLVNAARLKGVHLALKSGMIAGEVIGKALAKGDSSAETLSAYEQLLQASPEGLELKEFRTWRATYGAGMTRGALQDWIRRMGLEGDVPARADARPDFAMLRPQRSIGTRRPLPTPEPDGELIFDKAASLACSGTSHREEQPPHLVVPEPELCARKCAVEFGNPCQRFCPAAVYEWLPEGRLLIHAANCLHCKTCEIKDPYENIVWKASEGGGGPRYRGM